MIISIGELITGQRLVCVRKGEKVRDALVKMLAQDFSQLPIVDEQGRLTGIISEQTITRTYHYIDERVSLFDLTVDHCQTAPVMLPPEADVFEALSRLKNVPALVVVRDQCPVGILTYYDTTNFFRNVSEGLMYVEDVELTLRQYIEAVLDTENKLTAALFHAFGPDRRNQQEPAKEYERLSFYEYIQLITHEKNWPAFEPYLQPRELFRQLMDGVRDIRNQLAHFRDSLNTVQLGALLHARDWLAARRKPYTVRVAQTETLRNLSPEALAIHATGRAEGKYTHIQLWLEGLPKSTTRVQVTFGQVEQLLQEPLPASARTHRAWWANESAGHVQARAWMEAGWLVDDIDLRNETATFQRTVNGPYQLFYEDIVQRMNARRPGLMGATAARPKSWLSFGARVSGCYYGWTFVRERKFCLELYIATGKTETNKQYFDQLFQHKQAVEDALGEELNWDRLDKKGAARVRLERPGTIHETPEHLEQLKGWAIARMLDFVDTFQPRLRELFSE